MAQDVDLGCRCGEVSGRLRNAAPATLNRAICYCVDCQAFLHHIGRPDLLDPQGGTDIVQVAPQTVSFERGTERIVGVRLNPKGLFRWYASCCKTPLGNTQTPSLPFVGFAHEVFRGADGRRREELFGKVRGSVFGHQAIGGPPAGYKKLPLGLFAHSIRLLLGWKLGGKAWPHPFFSDTQTPRYPVSILSQQDRDALRPKCGPTPS